MYLLNQYKFTNLWVTGRPSLWQMKIVFFSYQYFLQVSVSSVSIFFFLNNSYILASFRVPRYLKGEKECRKSDLSSSRSECRSKPNPLQEWVDVFEFQITWLAKSRRPSLKTIFLFFVLFHFPQFKRHSGATNDGFVPIRLGNMRNPSTRWGTKKSVFFFYHTLLGSSIHVQNLLTRLIQNVEKSLKLQFFRITS